MRSLATTFLLPDKYGELVDGSTLFCRAFLEAGSVGIFLPFRVFGLLMEHLVVGG